MALGQVGRLVARDRAGQGEPDQHDTDGDGEAGDEQLAVETAVPGATAGGRREVVGDGARGGRRTIMPLCRPGTTRAGTGGSVLRRPLRITIQAPRLMRT